MDVIDQATAPDYRERYQTAQELREALIAAIAKGDVIQG
jgi:hypothetical protein